MKRRRFITGGAIAAILASANTAWAKKKPQRAKFKVYNGPEVTGVIIYKKRRKMKLLHFGKPLREYDIDLGFAPKGHKLREGDGRTPEGLYTINRDNPNSKYYLSLGVSYPNSRDRARAAAAGVSPGGDIFIHGGPRYRGERNKKDWTHGCISVSDAEMEDIFAMVKVGTPIMIHP
ncbi:hypothetical protein GCM10008927_10340 [Amylibacter ulvae]|uniref:L,D-TPase catalytic domain-containing protein n=1 Tax=Paramylibacter ulvae TaxID=1651968 RepID=A0ABQ3CYG9_9RHOB|nr:L,D-transpeptidase family protein [Amylibacter ulvae]GHA47465.1 hypothetical protein GCM10008927_10340 [Amylibacter ulvae]